MPAQITNIKQIADAIGISTTFVKALIGLSKPARNALRLQLNSLKRSLKGELSTFAFKTRIAKRKQIEINKVFSAANAKLSQAKRILNLLNFGPDFNNDPQVQKLIEIILSNAKIKGISLGGYRDIDNILNAINFKAQQIARTIDFVETGAAAINARIDLIDKYLNVLTEIDYLE